MCPVRIGTATAFCGAFPAILMADRAYAKEILLHVFTRQNRNVGIHSRLIDGTLLEPGFELDELCAPLIALENYLCATGDDAFFHEPVIRDGVRRILSVLETKEHPSVALYETSLMPTDDVCTYPYLTYDNVLVWKMLKDLGNRLPSAEFLAQADRVKRAIGEHCVQAENGVRFYCWSTDLNGGITTFTTNLPGVYCCLPYLGFLRCGGLGIPRDR